MVYVAIAVVLDGIWFSIWASSIDKKLGRIAAALERKEPK